MEVEYGFVGQVEAVVYGVWVPICIQGMVPGAYWQWPINGGESVPMAH